MISAAPTLNLVPFSVDTLSGAVVMGFDGHDHTLPALRWAASWAARHQAPLVLLGSCSEPVPNKYGVAPNGVAMYDIVTMEYDTEEPLLAAMADATHTLVDRHPGLEVRACVVKDSASSALDEASQHARLLVVGTRRRTGLESLALGSVSDSVVSGAACPVAVIAHDCDPLVVGPVVVGLDDGASCVAALEFAADEANVSGNALYTVQAYDAHASEAKVQISHTSTLAHIVAYGLKVDHMQTVTTDHVPNPQHQEAFVRRQDAPFDAHARNARGAGVMRDAVTAQERDNATIQELTERSDLLIEEYNRTHPNVDMVRIIHPGTPAEVLVEASEGASLIVVGTRNLNRWQRLFTTSTSREVTLKAVSPVVVVPHDIER